MHRKWALVVLLCSAARGQAPAYSAAGIVNAANFAPGPFATNSVVTLFGSSLSNNSTPMFATETGATVLPDNLNGVSVYIANLKAPVLYVSDTQINFLVPTELTTGTVPVNVVRQGVTGPGVNITLVTGAPALFPSSDGYALAVDWNNGSALMTAQAPAHAGDTVILYATGLGSAGRLATFAIPGAAAVIDNLSTLKVSLNGVPLDPVLIKYAGLTPGWAGLYQINIVLPNPVPADPEIVVAIGTQASPSGLKLAVK